MHLQFQVVAPAPTLGVTSPFKVYGVTAPGFSAGSNDPNTRENRSDNGSVSENHGVRDHGIGRGRDDSGQGKGQGSDKGKK